ncbi:hypothetical protein [Stutzerimonas xanthomarina]|uniref:hypothetical protein n=1 Tax=Stutzerimonas xanthomarina TaxID=271420 RepID=UPI00190A62E8|nr:hypothetical protein [Stutzerimonas xanthomarina]MBK3844801.1 hypothetical protein [Stutzerimonas xanthomarina]
MLSDNRIVVQPKGLDARVYQYRLGAQPQSIRLETAPQDKTLLKQLRAFVQTATGSLIDNSAASA